MPSLDFVSEFMNENCESVTEKNGKFHCRCPLCGDSQKSQRKKRFHLTFYSDDKIIYNCFNCNASGTFTKLYAFFKGIKEDIAYKELHGFTSVKKRLGKVKNNKLKTEDKKLIGDTDYRLLLEKDCVCENVVSVGYIESMAVKYLKKFRDERKVPNYVKLWFCLNGNYKHRIIIPIYDKSGKIVYFQGRRISSKQEPKYLNPSAPKSLIIPNIERLESNNPIVIVEGLLDSYSISNGTTGLGKSISEEFIKSLKKINEEIIVVFDNDDAGREARNKFFNENKYHKQVKYFLWSLKLSKAKDLNQIMVQNKLSIKEMDEIVRTNSYDYDDFYVRINLC
jgi:5S rRNA maturation endonuclease (ribonuclease M5)